MKIHNVGKVGTNNNDFHLIWYDLNLGSLDSKSNNVPTKPPRHLVLGLIKYNELDNSAATNI